MGRFRVEGGKNYHLVVVLYPSYTLDKKQILFKVVWFQTK